MNSRLRKYGLLLALPWLFAAAPNVVSSVVLPDVEGKKHSVAEYIGHGQWTVVTVWSVDCPICQREMYHMTFFHEEHRDSDARVLGLSVDGSDARVQIKQFIELQGLNFPNLIGSRADVAQLSSEPLRGTPTYLLFSPTGQLMARHTGAMTQEDVEQMIVRVAAQKTGGK